MEIINEVANFLPASSIKTMGWKFSSSDSSCGIEVEFGDAIYFIGIKWLSGGIWAEKILSPHFPVTTIRTTKFNNQKSYFLHPQGICVVYVNIRTISDYFTVQHYLTGCNSWDGVCLLRGTFYILRSAHTVYLCFLCGSENKQRLFHFTTLTDWFL